MFTVNVFQTTLEAVAVLYAVLLVLEYTNLVICLVGFILLVYFHGMVYYKTRKRQRSLEISQITASIDSRIAFTALLLTFAVFIFSFPIIVVIVLVEFLSIFRANSVFR